MEGSDQYAFVLNLFACNDALPFPIGHDLALDRSTPAQARRISEFLTGYGSGARMSGGPWLYEVEPIKSNSVGSHFFSPIAPEQRKFWVLNFLGDDLRIWRFANATQLTNAELEIGATFDPCRGDSIKQLQPARVFHFWEQHPRPIVQPLDAADLRDARSYQEKIEALAAIQEKAEQAVVRVYNDFVRISLGPRSGELVLLGHFALIEALITHEPSKSGDSLSHQLSTKMPLIMRRFELPLQLDSYFSIGDPNRLWKKLYGIRSRIAHGERVDARPGFLGDLRDLDTIFKFVRDALKRLIIYAMHEPQLIFDLKAC